MKPFLDLARHGGLLFDGAMGSLLYERGVFLTQCFEAVNLSQPDLVRQIHQEYLQVGARVLTTNTFGANAFRLGRHGLADQMGEINRAGVRLAAEVAGGAAHVAGSIGPTGVTFEGLVGPAGPQVEAALRAQMEALLDAGVDLLCLETFYVLQELELAIRVAKSLSDKPVVASYTFQPDGTGLGRLTPEQVGRRLVNAGADVIGSNCGGGPDLLYKVTVPMVPLGVPVLAQANAGRPETMEGRVIYVANPDYFGVFGRRLLKAGVKLIGGCCGTNPEHIRCMAGAARMFAVDDRTTPPGCRPTDDPTASEPLPSGDSVHISGGGRRGAAARQPEPALETRGRVAAALARGDFVTSVELNPPVGFDLRKRVDAARALMDFGVTAVNIADGPRASLRMSNVAMAVTLIREAGVEPLLHVCCRDRNFLGLQAHVLGAHVLGIRNLVIITGDPPKMGDYPNATPVYDVDSIGLLNLVTGYNCGVDPAGKPMPEQTRFLKITGAEPASLNYDRELRRLEMKRDAGAEAVMTQPVYDPRITERFLDDVAPLGLPILMGVIPLASHRNALFIHKNIPGMQVPGYVLDRMEQADAEGRGQEEGIAIAREMLAAFRHRVQGAYIMPPFDRHKVAMAVLDGFLEPAVARADAGVSDES